MTTVAAPGLVRRAMNWHRPLMIFAALMALSTVVSVGGLIFDDRVLTGDPIWLKPFKFSVSFVLYATTWAWMLSLQRRQRGWVWWSSTIVATLATLEMVIVIVQVIRGELSHFNASDDSDALLFRIMGFLIAALWLLNLAQGVVLLRDRLAERPVALAIRFGAVLGLIGMAVAFLMTGPTPDQLEMLRNDLPVEAIGAHSVGVPDGGPGMPITGWSTTGGDLRIPHFVGIHAMQALPLLALGLSLGSRRFTRLTSVAVRSRLVIVGGTAYAGLLGLVTWQALRGQPLIAPDAVTLIAAGALVAATALGVRWAMSAGETAATGAADELVEVRR